MMKSDQKMRTSFTRCFAKMSLAARHSEKMACDTTSDEQQDGRHADYLDI